MQLKSKRIFPEIYDNGCGEDIETRSAKDIETSDCRRWNTSNTWAAFTRDG